MLVHHSLSDYSTAASAAAKSARVKMEELIHKGSGSAMNVIEYVDQLVIKDRLSFSNKIEFAPKNGETINIKLTGLKEEYDLHPHALMQSTLRAGIPNATKFIELMKSHKEVGIDLLAHNLTTLFKQSDKTNLIRTVKDEVRGVLSDRFKRMDARPLLESFVRGCEAIGARPIEGFVEDTRVILRAVLPIVFEPVDNEVMLFGYEWRTSDFGHGAHCMNMWTKRLWCTNHAILDECLKQIHLGKRLDDSINFSQVTVDLNTEATASALYDTVVSLLNPARVDLYLDAIREMNETEMSPTQVKNFLKLKFDKAQTQAIIDQFNSADIEMMPAGQTKWRLANAISWVANEIDNVENKLYHQQVSGDLFPRYEKVQKVEIGSI